MSKTRKRTVRWDDEEEFYRPKGFKPKKNKRFEAALKTKDLDTLLEEDYPEDWD